MDASDSVKERARPLIFIAHSLGGIVLKKVLILAHERSETYEALLQNVRSTAFMGTPYRGCKTAYWTSYFTNLHAAQFGTNTNSRLLAGISEFGSKARITGRAAGTSN